MILRPRYVPLADAGTADVAVVIDVLRAFTTAAWMLHGGASKLLAVDTVDYALSLREHDPELLIAGEVNGRRPDNFDLSNSPAEAATADISGRTLVHRTMAGTQGLVRAASSPHLFAASFVTAAATARALRALDQRDVDFIITGASVGRDGDEDLAAAEYIVALANEQNPDPRPFLARVADSDAGQAFKPDGPAWASTEDLKLACEVNRFDFALIASTSPDTRAVEVASSLGRSQV